jgi:RNA polymerase sigma-70 factor (ECF subfamily)
LATAGEEFFRNHFDRLYAYVRMRVGERDCEDLVGDILLRAIEKLSQLKGDPAAWLFAIARSRIADHYRRDFQLKGAGMTALSVQNETLEQQPAPRSVRPLEQLEAAEFRALLQRKVATLSDVERDVIAFKFTDGLSNIQIAQVLGVTPSNLGVILHRALKRLRDAMLDG